MGWYLNIGTILLVQYAAADFFILETPLGKIQGSVLKSRLGRDIFSFRGVRYAEAPIHDLRFKPPVPVKQWNGIYNATKDGPLCPQPTEDPISEDCLILNVYSSKLPTSTNNPKRPVILFIHPGGLYSVGSTSVWLGPNYFMDQDIVLVTMNYRLGTLGFLSTGTEEAPGNNGFKDQVEALRWIQKNILSFGGDPDSVTIMGYSAGGWSVILHMVSPMSRGLFHKAVAMSGSPLMMPIPDNMLDLAKKQARLLNCPDDTIPNMITCLKNVPYETLGNSLSGFREYGKNPIIIWSPVIEKDFGQPRFLPDHPDRLIENGRFQKVPLITGQTEFEFGYKAFEIIGNETLEKEMNDDFEKVAPIAFGYERNSDRSKQISRVLRKFYFDDKKIDESQLNYLSELYSDSIIGFSNNRAAKLFTRYGDKPVYYYRLSYRGRFSHFYLPDSNNSIPYGVVHHDDLIYLFYIQKLFPLFGKDSPTEVEMVEKLTKLYANFAKTGNPTPESSGSHGDVEWKKFSLEEQQYLDIGNEVKMKKRLYKNRFDEWEKLFPIQK
nr:esterase FE4-like [Leptinotarsa decemlineata]